MSSKGFPTTPITRLQGHTGAVHAVTFSAGSGQYVLTGCQDRRIRLFNPSTGRLIQTYAAHGYEVLDLAVSTDNARLASVGGDKTVFLWDVATAQTQRRFAGHVGRVNACAFGGEDDSVVVSGSFDGTVKVWDTKSRSDKPIMSFSEAKDSVSSVAVWGHEVLAASVDGRVRVYDLAMGRVQVDVLPASVTSVVSAAAGDCYLASTLDSTLRLMDRSSGKCLQTFKDGAFKNEAYRIRSTLAMADSVAVSGSEDGSIFVWDVLSGDLLHRLWQKEGGGSQASTTTKKDVVAATAWNQLRKQLVTADGSGEVVVWGLEQ